MQLLADNRRADVTLSRQPKHLDAQLLPIAYIVVVAFLAVMPKAVVVARQQHPYVEPVAQHLLHELACRHLLEGIGEGQHFYAGDACSRYTSHLLIQRHEQRLLTVEGDCQRQHATLASRVDDLPQHELMSPMDTVEHSYGCYVFVHRLKNLYISPRMSTGEVIAMMSSHVNGGSGSVRKMRPP